MGVGTDTLMVTLVNTLLFPHGLEAMDTVQWLDNPCLE
jgi:hypothetical protein